MLQQRRRVHYLPLEQLDILQLRTAIFHTLKLDLKWCGREEIDPSPVRGVQIDTASLRRPAEGQAVTWVWFVEDGIHLICVVEDTVVHLWNLPSNKSILTFDVGGKLTHLSYHSDKDHLLIAGSVDPCEAAGGVATNPAFTVWKYNWNTIAIIDGLPPITVHALPVHPLYIIIDEAIVGAVYATENSANFPPVEKQGHTGYLTFLLMEWKGACRPTRRFTPMSFFGADRTHRWTTSCLRTLTHLSILFHTWTGVVVYAYDWAVISDLAVQQPAPGVEVPYAEIIYPRLKATYALDPEQSENPNVLYSGPLMWSYACLLWNGQKIGIVGNHLCGEIRRRRFSLSVLDLSPLLAHDDGIPNYDLQEQYVRRFTGDGTFPPHFSTNNQLLISQPRHTGSIVWVLRSPNGHNVISALALARYIPQEVFQAGAEIKTPCAIPADAGVEIPATQRPLTEHSDLEIKREEQFLRIGLDGWIPKTEQAENIDLDDRLGRVVFGMNSGKVYILEFV